MNRKQERGTRGTKNKGDKQKINKIVELNSNISIIRVKVSSLNTQTKGQIVSLYFFKNPIICYLQETYFKYNERGR